MDKHHWLAILLLFLLVGCTGTQTPTISPTPSIIIKTPQLQTATVTITSTPTIKPTSTPSLTFTPTVMPLLSWSKELNGERFYLGKFKGIWSPASDELLLIGQETLRGNEDSIKKANPPFFDPVTMKRDNSKTAYIGAYAWSPDGKYIVFTGPYHDVPSSQEGFESIWMMDKNGENPHPVQSDRPANERKWFFGDFLGWDGSDTLYYSYGAGSGFSHVKGFNLLSGKMLFSDILSSRVYPPHHGFIPYEALGATMIVDMKYYNPNKEQHDAPYIRRPTQNGNQILGSFQGWLPKTNKALILTKRETSETDTSEGNLMLWDMDTDQLEEVISNAIFGRYSNDGKTLAFATLKPINPGQPESTPDAQPGVISGVSQHYVQLFDVNTKTIFFSSRTVSIKDRFPSLNPAYENYFDSDPFVSFSPNDRYFVFLEPASDQRIFLKVFDTALHKVIFSTETSIQKPYPAVWDGIHEWCSISPDSNMLLYADAKGNLVVLYLNTLKTLEITDSGGFRVEHTSWSFDSQYLLITYLDSYDTPPIWLTPESVVLRIPKQ